MKFTLHNEKHPSTFWNGNKPLPVDIHVISYDHSVAEFELLTILCSLHGFISAFDILTGANPDSEKDKDIEAIMTAFQLYLFPKMPISNYDTKDKRMKSMTLFKLQPIQPET